MMPSTNTRQDTTVLMYLKVSLISMGPSHGGGVRGGIPALLPPLGICGVADERGSLALDLPGQEVSVGVSIISTVPRSGWVAPAGGSSLSSAWMPATPQARISATRARPHKLGSGCMLPPAPQGVGWPLLSFPSLETSKGRKTGHPGQRPQPRPCKPLFRSAAAPALSARESINKSSWRRSGELWRVVPACAPRQSLQSQLSLVFPPLRPLRGKWLAVGRGILEGVWRGGKDGCPKQSFELPVCAERAVFLLRPRARGDGGNQGTQRSRASPAFAFDSTTTPDAACLDSQIPYFPAACGRNPPPRSPTPPPPNRHPRTAPADPENLPAISTRSGWKSLYQD